MAKRGDDTPEKHGLRTPWKSGQSGNPAGRPKGSRVKLSEEFLADLLQSWQEHGQAVIARVIQEKPEAFLKVVASLLPKDLNLSVDPIGLLTDDQIVDRIRWLDERIGPLLNRKQRTRLK